MAASREVSVFYTLHKSCLLQVLYQQKQESKFCDVIMKVCGVEIYAHSNVLAGASPYFDSFLSHDLPRQFSQRSPQVIEIQIDGSEDSGELYERAVSSVVDFVYTGEMLLSSINAAQVYEIAKIMQIEALVKYCEEWLQGVTPDGAIFGLKEIGTQTANQVSQHVMVDASVETLPRNHKKSIDSDLIEFNVDNKRYNSKQLSKETVNSIESNIDACVSDLKPKRRRGRPPKTSAPDPVAQEAKPCGSCRDASPKCKEEPMNIQTDVSSAGSVRRSSRSYKPTLKAKSLYMGKLLKLKAEVSSDTETAPVQNFGNLEKNINNNETGISDKKDTSEDTVIAKKNHIAAKKTTKVIFDDESDKHKTPPKQKDEQLVDKSAEEKENNSSIIDEAHIPLRELMQETLSALIHQGDTEKYDVVKVENCDREEHRIKEKRDSVAYKCDHCVYATDNIYRFRRHMMRHGMARFRCDECPFKTAMIREYKNHMKIHLLEKNICHYCDSKFDIKDDLNEHLLKHKGPKPYFCNLCGWRFKLHAQLLLHVPKHSDDKPYKCKLCSASFKWKHALKNHLVIHSGKKEHLCDICGYATAHKGQLKAHHLIHTGETIHCPVPGCKFQATKSQNLKYHMLTHTKEKPHQCEVCGQAFSLSKNMRRHRLLHSQVRDIRCDQCSFQTTRLDKLKEHKYRDHQIGEPPAKKIKISDMVASNFGLNSEEEKVQEPLQGSPGSVVMPKKEILLMTTVGLPISEMSDPQSYKVNLEKGLEELAGSTLVKEEDDTVTQAILIDPSGTVTQETQSVAHEPQHPFNLDSFGRVVISEEGTHLGYIDKDGNFIALAAPGEIVQAPEVNENIEAVETTVEQVVEGEVISTEQVQYTELVLPEDQVQALVNHVNSVEASQS